jgi:hypothetical protein
MSERRINLYVTFCIVALSVSFGPEELRTDLILLGCFVLLIWIADRLEMNAEKGGKHE